jgi:hypothetical protein
MIDLDKLEFHVATRDAQGNAVLLPKPRPPEYDKADAISRRHYAHAAAKEFEEVNKWARQAALPDRPANWDTTPPLGQRQWFHQVRKG